MKYYSELTKKPYDTIEELENAEREIRESKKAEDAKRAERAKAAKDVEEAFKRASEARKDAEMKLNDFCKKYGSFHRTYRGLSDIVDEFVDFILC